MPIQNVTTINEQHINPHDANPFFVDTPSSDNNEINKFSAFFELLSQIDQRLRKEDINYKNKYYTDSALERKNQ